MLIIKIFRHLKVLFNLSCSLIPNYTSMRHGLNPELHNYLPGWLAGLIKSVEKIRKISNFLYIREDLIF